MLGQTLFPDVQVHGRSQSERWLPFAPIQFSLLQSDPLQNVEDSFVEQQQKDPWIQDMFVYLEQGRLPVDESKGWKVAAQSAHFAVVNSILYYVDSKSSNHKRVIIPLQFQWQILREGHCGLTGGHFSGKRTFNALAQH